MFLVHVDFDDLVPTTGNYCVIVARIADVANFASMGVMLIQRENIDTRYKIKNLHLTLMTANNELPVVRVKLHLSDVGLENVSERADWLSSPGVPNLDGPLACNVNLKSFVGELSTGDGIVV